MNTLSEPAASTKDAAIHWSLRDIPLSHGKHVCGRVAWTPPPQSVPVESDLEAEAVAFFTQQPDLAAIHAQPFTINYSDHGAPRRYTPDLLVVFNRIIVAPFTKVLRPAGGTTGRPAGTSRKSSGQRRGGRVATRKSILPSGTGSGGSDCTSTKPPSSRNDASEPAAWSRVLE